MSAGAFRHVALAGFSLLELNLVLGIIALLGVLGAASAPPCRPALAAVQGELRAGVEQAFLLARARDRSVRVALGGHGPACRDGHRGCGEVLALTLPPGVRWGLPGDVPLPPGMEATRRAQHTGQAHPCLTVSPGRSAEAGAWFLTDGRDAVCLRLSDRGQVTLLRWRHRPGRWERG